MNYSLLLALHSLLRWLVLAALLYVLFRAYRGWLGKKRYTPHDDFVRHFSATLAHLQLVAGIGLYFVSPVISYFMEEFSKAVHERQIRFFGMEHSTMMLLAIVLMTIGAFKAKRKESDEKKFKSLAIWYSIVLLIILVNIPWPFSPFASRPWMRAF